METPRIQCVQCKFYYVTWDPAFPKGCRYFEFKSHKMPSQVVKESSGKECPVFTPKYKA